jgi:hypothetical protein
MRQKCHSDACCSDEHPRADASASEQMDDRKTGEKDGSTNGQNSDG